MYYKIENKESDVYKKLHRLRSSEIAMDENNIKSINEKTGLKWETFLGHFGQQNFCRVTLYSGFLFTEPEKVDPKVWKNHPDEPGIFIPNTRTKAGREMKNFLNNGLQKGCWHDVHQILSIEQMSGRFILPFVEICKDVIIIRLDDTHIPESSDVIEITSKEFNEHFENSHKQ